MAVMERITEPSPRTRARITGAVYLLFFLTAVLGALVTPGISVLGGVSGDAAATANNILAHESAYRLGFALTLISTACYVALMGLFYQLFRPVSRSLSLMPAFLGLARLRYCQVDLPARNPGCADRGSRPGMADLSVTAARHQSVHLQCCPRLPGGACADAVAPRGRCQR